MFAIGSFSRVVYAFVLVAVFASACEADWKLDAESAYTQDPASTFVMKVYAYDSNYNLVQLPDVAMGNPRITLPNFPYPGMTTYKHSHDQIVLSNNYNGPYGEVWQTTPAGTAKVVTVYFWFYSP